jgi:hypothetical protein
MANTYKNIVITPNIGSGTDDPKITFSGANNTVNTDITLRVYPTSNGTLSFEGSAGQLFSVTNDLTGVIFSVNDISGIPSLEIDANGRVSMAQFSGNVGIGTASPTYKLDVSGDMRVTGNVILGDASTDTITINGSFISLGNNQSIDTGTLFIDAVNNEVGIGTTSPTSNLHVIGTANITSSVVIGQDIFTQNVKFNGGSTVRAFSTLASNTFIITNGAQTNKYALQVESGAGAGGIQVYRSGSSYSIGDTGGRLLFTSTNWGGMSFGAIGTGAFAANNGIFRFSGDTNSYNTSNGVIQVIANANVGYYIRFTKDGLTTTSNLRANDVFTVAYDGTVNTKSNVEAIFFKGNGSLLTGITTDFSPVFIQANTARDHANSAFIAANSAFANGNTTHTLTIAAFGAANASFANGNTNFSVLQVVSGVANAAFSNANGTHTLSIAAFSAANAAFGNANTTHTLTVASFAAANASFANGNTNFSVLQVVSGVANAAFSNGNTTHTLTIAAFGAANSAFANGNTNFSVLQVVSNVANLGFQTANASFANGNTNFTVLQVVSGVANDAYLQANTARTHANSAFANANGTHTLTIAAFEAANAAFANSNTNFGVLQVASNVANLGFETANASFANGNTNFSVLQVVSNVANNGWLTANAAFSNANGTHTLTISSFAAANASFANGNTNFSVLQAVSGVANAAFANANSTHTLTIGAFSAANASFANGNTNFGILQAVSGVANAAFSNGNTTHTLTISAFGAANSAFANGNTNFGTTVAAFSVANSGIIQANTARDHANSAFAAANVANNLTVANTGTIIGSRNILNFVPGGNVVITFADDAVGDRINVSISAIAGSGGGSGALSFTSNVGDAAANTFNIAHNLNTTTIIPAVREISTGYYVYPDIKTTTPNHIVLEFVSIPTANQYFLILLGA